MRWVGADEVRSGLPPPVAIDAVETALGQLASGRAGTSGREFSGTVDTPLAVMPGYADGCLGLKVITVVEANPARGLPMIQGVVVVFAEGTGELVGIVDGPSLTAVRTAAIAGAATRRLAVPDAQSLLMVGAGAQGPAQVEAVMAVRPIIDVAIWNRTLERARALAVQVAELHPEATVRVAGDLQEAAAQADVITLATATSNPLLRLDGLRPHCHVNAMGAYQPDRRELSTELVAAAHVYADTVEGCLSEAGDLLIPIAEGRLERDSVRSLTESRPEDRERLTVMKSVGSAIFDLACAARLLLLHLIEPDRTESSSVARSDA